MRIRTDDAATRVEFTFYDLPGEARWFQWVRFYIVCLVGIPLVSFTLWLIGSLFMSGPWLIIVSGLVGASVTVAAAVAGLSLIGRYETPATPLAYRLHQLRAELAAPRTPQPEEAPALDMPDWQHGPTAAPVHEPVMFGAPNELQVATTQSVALDSPEAVGEQADSHH